jgi:DNA-binding NarL/FixJ family response regulator
MHTHALDPLREKTTLSNISSALIADDDAYFRIAMRNILNEKLGITDTQESETFDEAIDWLSGAARVDLALLDLAMPGMDVACAIRTIRDTFPTVKVVIVSASKCRTDILRCLEAGAHGYIHKGMGPRHLAKALQLVSEGLVFVPPFLPDICSDDVPPSIEYSETDLAERNTGNPITPRQIEVLHLLVRGCSNKVIARELSLSEGAVKFHLSALFRRLGARNRVEAATNGARFLGAKAIREQEEIE